MIDDTVSVNMTACPNYCVWYDYSYYLDMINIIPQEDAIAAESFGKEHHAKHPDCKCAPHVIEEDGELAIIHNCFNDPRGYYESAIIHVN